MFKFDSERQYMMPAHFGHRVCKEGEVLYEDATTMTVAFRTDPEVVSRYLPAPFEVGKEPLVSVSYCRNGHVPWLAGRSYNIIAVNVSAEFNGEVDHVAGDYCLVVWENLTDPIIGGRELQGIPKIYADIEDHTIQGDAWSTSASHFGSTFIDITIRKARPIPESFLQNVRESVKQRNWMGWKHIPATGVEEPGAEVSHATLFPTAATIDEAWYGKGEICWHRLTWEQNPTQHHIVNALADLPIVEYRFSVISKGTTNLVVPSARCRPLK